MTDLGETGVVPSAMSHTREQRPARAIEDNAAEGAGHPLTPTGRRPSRLLSPPALVPAPTKRGKHQSITRRGMRVHVVPEVGLRLTQRKRLALQNLFEAARTRWNDLAARIRDAYPSLVPDEAHPPFVNALAPRIRGLAPRDKALPTKVAEGVEHRMAGAVRGAARAVRRIAGRIERQIARELESESGEPDERVLEYLQGQLYEVAKPGAALERLPHHVPTPAECDRAWLAALDYVALAGSEFDRGEAHRLLATAAREFDPPPIDFVRARDCPCLISPPGPAAFSGMSSTC